jgi:hypothetical protein
MEVASSKVNCADISALKDITGVDFDCENPDIETNKNKRVIFFIKNYIN